MSKTLLILFTIFLLLVLVFYAVKSSYSPNSALPSLSILQSPTPISENTLSIVPNPANVISAKPDFVSVIITSQGETVSLIQLELAYDPNMITDVHIIPGSYFMTSNVRLNTIDKKNGRISYVITPAMNQSISKTSDVVAIINFTPTTTTIERQTTFTFLPKTAIQTRDTKNTLKVAYGSKIIINPLKAPSATRSATTVFPNQIRY